MLNVSQTKCDQLGRIPRPLPHVRRRKRSRNDVGSDFGPLDLFGSLSRRNPTPALPSAAIDVCGMSNLTVAVALRHLQAERELLLSQLTQTDVLVPCQRSVNTQVRLRLALELLHGADELSFHARASFLGNKTKAC